jgi:spore photoproduct lyase
MHFCLPKRIIVEEDVAESRISSNLRMHLPDARFSVVSRIPERAGHDPERLEVVAFRGRLLKSCPGTRHYLCCGYRILHFGVQCSLGCTYCILQAYLNQPNLRLFGNIEEILRVVLEELHSHPERLHRIGTGEFTDSLLLDPWTALTKELVPFFARQHNAVLELKTKTDFVENLAGLDHGGRTIVAWSLNTEAIACCEEPRAAPLEARFQAARRCAEWGYPLAFHFDPMIEHENWRAGYGEVIERLFAAVDAGRIVWLSLGALRFMPELKPIFVAKHPDSRIMGGEFVRGLDGKMRYFRDIRIEMYRFMADRIRAFDPGLPVYLCMEGRDVWREALGFSPEERGGLPAVLDRAVNNRI